MTTDRRVKRYNVRLSNDMAERFELLASDRGLPPSTLISAVVGDYVATQAYQKAHVQKMMSDPEFVKNVQDGSKNHSGLLDT